MTKSKKDLGKDDKKNNISANSNKVYAEPIAEEDSDDEIQMTLAPYIQTYLAHSNSQNCWGCLPVPFERSAPHSWILPSFDSEILEKQFKISSLKQYTKRFRFALIYVMIFSAAWLIFLLSQPHPDTIKFEYIIFAQMFLFTIWILFLSYKNIYRSHDSIIGVVTALHLVFTSLVLTLSAGTTMVSHFTLPFCTILAIYTAFPLPPYVSLIICFCFSAFLEIIILTLQRQFNLYYHGFAVRVLCQICVHIIGFHILVMTHVRVRGTFMKVGQRLLVRKQLEMEKGLKENIIHSVMPPKVANWLLGGEGKDNPRPSNNEDLGSLFRPFNMNRMENVSILFADIVGFTRMSSNKTAEEIVDILNDLFERFDDLCLSNGCEKISTLGDCYYCVSGCPEPRADHANCCVEMGLDMIDAIRDFDLDRGEDVSMRVGVHTGTVLCGIVGTRRFKFDVWSNDVTFANKLESTGQPGRVHVSEQTARFLRDFYILENYETIEGVKTYLIKSRAKPILQDNNASESPFHPQKNPYRKSINFSNSSYRKNHYLSLLTDTRSKFASLPNVLGSSRGLTESLEKLKYSQWFSFSKLKKTSYSDVSPDTKNSNHRKSFAVVTKPKDPFPNNRYSAETSRNPILEEETNLTSLATRNSILRYGNRRNSVQHQIFLLNGLNQGEATLKKLESYHNSSFSSMSPLESESENEIAVKRPGVTDSLSLGFYSLRKQSDLLLIKCIKDLAENSQVVKVPLDQITLFFKDKATEKEYRANAHEMHEKIGDGPTTLSTTRFNTYFDIFISGLILICTTVSVYILEDPSPYFISISTMALVIEFFALFLCVIHIVKTARYKASNGTQNSVSRRSVFNLLSKWYLWQCFGGILVSLPTIVVLSNLALHYVEFSEKIDTFESNVTFKNFITSSENLKLVKNFEMRDQYQALLLLVGLFHFCNFTQLNSFLKSFLGLVAGVVFLFLFGQGSRHYFDDDSAIFVSKFLQHNLFLNNSLDETKYSQQRTLICCSRLSKVMEQLSVEVPNAQAHYNLGLEFLNSYSSNEGDSIPHFYFATDDGLRFLANLNQSLLEVGIGSRDLWLKTVLTTINRNLLAFYFPEIVLDIIITIILVVLLNREFEISYRLSYYCNTESNKDKIRVQNMKNQADWLLENIIPKHVSIELKNRAKYCKTHSNVGIMFASLVNFNKLYDETYSGGKEYLRVLNELISDFDELLKLDQFKNVDKIKTIGSTYMGASGLDPGLRKENATEYDYVYELMNFAFEMYRVVDVFNKDLLGFNLILRVGFNVGEVTAGVIGSSKLFYDIWGDAVNVASRMDSCGIDGQIQVPHSCASILSRRYNLEPRGQVYIKGKGDIMVYLVKR